MNVTIERLWRPGLGMAPTEAVNQIEAPDIHTAFASAFRHELIEWEASIALFDRKNKTKGQKETLKKLFDDSYRDFTDWDAVAIVPEVLDLWPYNPEVLTIPCILVLAQTVREYTGIIRDSQQELAQIVATWCRSLVLRPEDYPITTVYERAALFEATCQIVLENHTGADRIFLPPIKRMIHLDMMLELVTHNEDAMAECRDLLTDWPKFESLETQQLFVDEVKDTAISRLRCLDSGFASIQWRALETLVMDGTPRQQLVRLALIFTKVHLEVREHLQLVETATYTSAAHNSNRPTTA